MPRMRRGDVIHRLRSVLDSISLHYGGPDSRVLVVAHQVIVLCFRYLLEHLDEDQILEIDRGAEVANCGVLSYAYDGAPPGTGELTLRACNFVAPLQDAGALVTSSPDAPGGVK